MILNKPYKPSASTILGAKPQERIEATHKALLKEKCSRDFLFWLSNYVFTFNEKAKLEEGQKAVEKFPVKDYVKEIALLFLKHKVVHVAKSRQMTISWLGMAFMLWEAQFKPFRFQAVMSKKLEDAEALIDRIKFIYENQPRWLKELLPLDRKLRDMPKGHLFFENGSKIKGFPQGRDQIRSYVISRIFIDEAAFQDEFEDTYGACLPCCDRIITVSSAGAGFFRKLVEL